MKKNIKARRRIKIYLFIIICLISYLGYKMSYYWPKIYSNYQKKAKLEEEYEKLLEEENILSNNILKLQDPGYITRYAREKYLYSKNGEIIIRIVDKS